MNDGDDGTKLYCTHRHSACHFLFIYVFIVLAVVGVVACCCFYGYYCYLQTFPLWHLRVYRIIRIALWWIDLPLPFVRLDYSYIQQIHNGGTEMFRDTIMALSVVMLVVYYNHLLSIICILPCRHKSPMSWRSHEHALHWGYFQRLERRHEWV